MASRRRQSVPPHPTRSTLRSNPSTLQLDRQFDIGQHTFDGVSRAEKEKHRALIKENGSFMGYKLPNYWEIKAGVRDRIEHYNFYQNR